jgi:periplasmic protein CpxP/Spy
MKTERKILATTALVLGMAVSGFGFAEAGDGAGPHGGGPHGGMMAGQQGHVQERMASKLNLTDEQKKKVEEMRASSKQESQTLRDAMRSHADAERQAVESGAAEAELRSLARKTADARVDMMIFGMKMDKEFRAILTPEQLTQLDQMKAERKARFEEHRKQRQQRMENSQP